MTAARRPIAPTLTLALAACALLAPPARGAGQADALFKLIPPDAGATLAVEGLAAHARTVLASPLAAGLRRLPAVARWQASGDVKKLREAVGRLEAGLGADAARLRDGLLGEAVVLALRLPPDAQPDAARGLLLAKVPDRTLLDRLVAGVNAAQTREGALRKVTARRHAGVEYFVREFAPGTRTDEAYLVLDGGLFAWSNSEELIHGVIDRRAGGMTGLADVPAFREVRQALPDNALASLYVDPRFAERVLAAVPAPAAGRDERVMSLLVRYLSALRYAGAALTWRDGPVLHTEERVDPSKLGPGLLRWAGRTGPDDPLRLRVPPAALAAATVQVDLVSLLELFRTLTPEADRVRVDNLVVAVQGMLLGRDLRGQVLPALGPAVEVHVERPDGRRMPVVLTFPTAASAEGAAAASAVDNALRTFLALTSLDAKRPAVGSRLETRQVGSATVTSLAGESTPYAFAVHEGRVVVGTSAEAVARAVAARSDPHAGARFRRVREQYAPEAGSFACVDLRALFAFADAHRPAVARRNAERQHVPVEQAARDLDQALALIELFDSAYLTSTVGPSFTRVHRTLGLVARESPSP